MPTRSVLAVACLALAAGACALTPSQRAASAARIAQSGGLSAVPLDTHDFTLAAYERVRDTGRDATLVVYVEGDGFAWVTRARVSDDPTPGDPIALRLAVADDAPNVLYLARPCQFTTAGARRNCAPKYWSTARFSREVVGATGQAIDLVRARTGAARVELIGYSGGGVLATLVAAGRDDVVRVITVAANLDVSGWAAHHRVTPLSESLSPMDFLAPLGRVPQVMLVGDRDRVVPPAIVERYRAAFPPGAPAVVLRIPDFSHDCCWAAAWPDLLRRARAIR